MLKFKEINRLYDLLSDALYQKGLVCDLYPYLDKLGGIERVELQKIITLCENNTSIEDIMGWIRYVTLSRVEGRIYYQNNGRFIMDSTGIEFTSGKPIEVYIPDDPPDGGWHIGRVEHAHRYGGYYFYSHTGEHCDLRDGMIVAVRK